MTVEVDRLTVRVSNIPQTATAKDLFDFFNSALGNSSVYAIEITTDRKNWKSRGFGRVQFDTLAAKSTATELSSNGNLAFKGSHLSLSPSFDDVVVRPVEQPNRAGRGVLHCGFLVKDDCLCVVESLEGFKAWVMPERKSIEFWVVGTDGEWYKLELQYDYVLESCGCWLGGGKEPNAVLLKLKHGPKIYQKMAGPNITSKVIGNRYYFCKEDFEFIWVRTTDFSKLKSMGQSSSLCWEMKEESPALNIFTCLPYYKKDPKDLILEDGEEFGSTSELVPLVRCQSDAFLPYEILYQLNSLVHTHKISLGAVDDDLIEILGSLDVHTAMMILQKLHKLHSTCYEPLSFIKTRLHVLNAKKLPSSSRTRLTNENLMRCHRILVSPSKIYCLGPELETSNYVVKIFSAYASDFVRVTFVEEDWSKLPVNALSTSLQQGIFAKPYRTNIYHRILSVLKEGIVIGAKRFEFLAFSASQLRSNAVWMFASNENVTAQDIREWMGCFNKIRSVSKCAARMGQLFSSSRQTLEIPSQEVEVIPDVEVTTDGIGYCFSDGIGKISLSFATQVAQKCGLNHTPSAFQIRYGGYKGVIAVDRNSFRKISLRGSMLKFESENRMLNVTKWSDSMPCYLNREVVSLLSSLGVEDEVFEAMQDRQLCTLEKMLTSREVALGVLESMSGSDAKGILAQMLVQGYEPNVEPYLSMMLRAHHNSLLSDLRSRCRIFVPKGRILIGCLDETGILEYGQVYCRTTMTKTELLQLEGQSFFQKVDETTSVVIGKVVVTKNPCLHPGDVRVLEAVYEVALEEKGLVDCVVFPQKGERPHPNECSGGDLDGDLYFISWDENLIPPKTVPPMDYTGRRPRIMDHTVTLQEIQKFFVDYMINDNLGAISTAHLIHADRDPAKALSPTCLHLATLHSMAVDYAKTGAPAEMPRFLKPKEFPDFMERTEKPTYISKGVLGKLYRATKNSKVYEQTDSIVCDKISQDAYDHDLILDGFEDFIDVAKGHKEMYMDKMSTLMNFYGAESEDEILTGNLRKRSTYLQRDNRRYYEMKDRIMVSVKSLSKEARGWFDSSCKGSVEQQKLASAWYHITYHPTFCQESSYCLGFPWIVGDILLNVKSVKSRMLPA